MLKLALKNIWARRRANGWLFAELVAVTVVAWMMIDPLVVQLYDRSLPVGYDTDRLCMIKVLSEVEGAPGYDAALTDSASTAADYMRLVEIARRLPGVEKATPLKSFCYPDAGSQASLGVYGDADSTMYMVSFMYFMPGSDFFSTYGIGGVDGGTAESLDRMRFRGGKSRNDGQRDFVISETVARNMFKPGNVAGRTLSLGDDSVKVGAVCADVRYLSSSRNPTMLFIPDYDASLSPGNSALILVRLSPGVDAGEWVEAFRERMPRFTSGNLHAREAYTYRSMTDMHLYSNGGSDMRLKTGLLVFFLLNLSLGVFGTLWLQTRRRAEEAGVMKAFGATRCHIVGLVVTESVILTVAAWLAGCLIYLQVALYNGLSQGQNHYLVFDHSWAGNFALHFAVVSGLVLALLLAVVVVGVLLPAMTIARVRPIDSLNS